MLRALVSDAVGIGGNTPTDPRTVQCRLDATEGLLMGSTPTHIPTCRENSTNSQAQGAGHLVADFAHFSFDSYECLQATSVPLLDSDHAHFGNYES